MSPCPPRPRGAVAQPAGAMDPTQRVAEVGAGVDLLAVLLLSTPLWGVSL